MEERKRRIGLNEAVFRQVNESLQSLNEGFGTITDTMVLICECGDPACADQIEMSVREYEQVRADPALFAVTPGHETVEVEGVVRKGAGYDVVRKNAGLPSRVAEATDPRS
jgi:hypothetical protein